jgi:hypothetical protein
MRASESAEALANAHECVVKTHNRTFVNLNLARDFNVETKTLESHSSVKDPLDLSDGRRVVVALSPQDNAVQTDFLLTVPIWKAMITIDPFTRVDSLAVVRTQLDDVKPDLSVFFQPGALDGSCSYGDYDTQLASTIVHGWRVQFGRVYLVDAPPSLFYSMYGQGVGVGLLGGEFIVSHPKGVHPPVEMYALLAKRFETSIRYMDTTGGCVIWWSSGELHFGCFGEWTFNVMIAFRKLSEAGWIKSLSIYEDASFGFEHVTSFQEAYKGSLRKVKFGKTWRRMRNELVEEPFFGQPLPVEEDNPFVRRMVEYMQVRNMQAFIQVQDRAEDLVHTLGKFGISKQINCREIYKRFCRANGMIYMYGGEDEVAEVFSLAGLVKKAKDFELPLSRMFEEAGKHKDAVTVNDLAASFPMELYNSVESWVK